jgi:hypothetical protein
VLTRLMTLEAQLASPLKATSRFVLRGLYTTVREPHALRNLGYPPSYSGTGGGCNAVVGSTIDCLVGRHGGR